MTINVLLVPGLPITGAADSGAGASTKSRRKAEEPVAPSTATAERLAEAAKATAGAARRVGAWGSGSREAVGKEAEEEEEEEQEEEEEEEGGEKEPQPAAAGGLPKSLSLKALLKDIGRKAKAQASGKWPAPQVNSSLPL